MMCQMMGWSDEDTAVGWPTHFTIWLSSVAFMRRSPCHGNSVRRSQETMLLMDAELDGSISFLEFVSWYDEEGMARR